MLQLLNKEYNLLSDNTTKRILCFGIPVFMCLFLILFEPFNLNLTENLVKKYSVIFLYSFSGALIWIIHLYGLLKNKLKYTAGSTVLLLIWVHLLIGITIFFIHEISLNHNPFVIPNLPLLILWTYLSGIIPIIFVMLIYKSNLTKSKVKIINQLNKNLTEISASKNSTLISITSDNESAFLNIPEHNILYFQAAGNYVDAYYIENNQNIKHILIRNTLSTIQLQLVKQSRLFLRCHNSYIVNQANIDKITGNSAGYKAVLKNSKAMVPISKKYKNELFNRLKPD